MLKGRNRTLTAAIFVGLLASGITLLATPSTVEENYLQYSTQGATTTSELDAPVGYAPPGYLTDAHITANNQVTVKLKLAETSNVLFSNTFPAGTFDLPKIVIVNGGNLFLTIEPQNAAFTQMNVFARIFREITTYPYAMVGLLILSIAGLFGLSAFFPHTAFGRVARRLVPVHKMGVNQAVQEPRLK